MQRGRRVLVGVAAAGAVAVAVAGVVALGATGGDPALAGVRVEPTAVEGCRPAAVTVTLDRPAPAEGIAVALTSSSAAAAVPEQVTVLAGASEATVEADTVPVAAAERAQVRAAAAGSEATAAVEVVPVQAATVAGDDPDPACQAGFTDLHGYSDPERVGAFDAELIPEASGLAASRRNPGWLYVVDDERPREVYAMRPDGSSLTPILLEGFQGRDTEALAVGPCGPADPTPCVYVGDIGDNLGQYADVALLRFPEPDLSAPGGQVGPVAPDTIRVSYPNGPIDAEALLVDDAATLYIVTKDPGPDGEGAARLYATDGFTGGTLTDLGPVAVPQPARPLVAAFLGVLVTGGDHHQGRVALRTYDSVVEFVAPSPGAPLAAFPSWPVREVPAARQPQSEAVAYAADGCGYYTVSEIVGDIWFVGCRR